MCRLENLGFTVLAVCCDGLAANRRLFSLHKPGSKTPVHKVLNPYAHNGEKRYLYFLSDPPHLMKTVRNCWANSKRKLWVRLILLRVHAQHVHVYIYTCIDLLDTCISSVVQWNGHILGTLDGALQEEQSTSRGHRSCTSTKVEV